MTHFLTILCVFLGANLFQITETRAQNVCDSDRKFSKCRCTQTADNFENIPLFVIDCARVDLTASPQQSELPAFLGHVDFSHNKITTLNDSTKLTSDTLYHLDYAYNNLQTIPERYFANLTHLVILNLKHNRLTNLSQNGFSGLTMLKVLNLQSNRLKALPENVLAESKALDELHLSYNNIGSFLEKVALKHYIPNNVTVLYLDHIGMRNITKNMFDAMKQLKLTVAYNLIQELPNLSQNNLEYLDVSGTNITHLGTDNMMYLYLKTLRLNRLPHLTRINAYAFANLHALEQLSIEHCPRLAEIDPMTFGYLQARNSTSGIRLQRFSVAYSGLNTLSDSFQFIFEDIQEVDLRGNYWNCDCSLKWFRFLKKNVIDIDETRCFTPLAQSNKTVHSLTDTDLPCMEQRNYLTEVRTPMQAWLFPLVGILSVVVIVLVAMLIYMGPYGKQMQGRMKSIGPESPYSPITIQPNRAENFDTLF